MFYTTWFTIANKNKIYDRNKDIGSKETRVQTKFSGRTKKNIIRTILSFLRRTKSTQ